jgi:hypothetical protein
LLETPANGHQQASQTAQRPVASPPQHDPSLDARRQISARIPRGLFQLCLMNGHHRSGQLASVKIHF